MAIFWHRRDLRLEDNRGLARATADDPVVPVFVLDEGVLGRLGDRQRAFVLGGVRALREAYRERGSDLIVREGVPADVLADLAAEHDADAVYYDECYQPARRTRERRVRQRLPATAATDLVLVDPATLADRYETHSRFHDDWTDRPKPAPEPAPDPEALASVSDDAPIPSPEVDVALPEPGHDAARERWEAFLESGIERYADRRDDMRAAVESPSASVSRMSPYLAAGMIGVRELWVDATERHDAASGDARRNVEKYRYELSWREANYHLLYHEPSVATDSYVDFDSRIAWENDAAKLAAWKRGETGYPLVDAGMRQLEREGYVHNRPRQNVASFLAKHLLVDWRAGERHFAEKLIDYDPASNPGNWQWAASTGTDSVDVRIFDPVAQMAKYDPEATYVTEYVPELRGVDPGLIVDWPTLSDERRESLAPDYPHPIVDRDAAYDRAQRVFERALGKR